MKAIFTLAVIATLSLTSCFKARTCKCSDGDVIPMVSVNKSQTKTVCESASTSGVTCSLSK